MILRIRRIVGKKLLFFIGILLTGVIGIMSSYIRTNYSKGSSLVVPKAHADTPSCVSPYTQDQCDVFWSCFPADTAISTPSGDKVIQDFSVGDMVYGFDSETGKIEASPVTRTFKHGRNDTNGVYSPLIKIFYEGGSLLVTDNHLIYRRNGRIGEYANFDRAGTLEVGDMLTMESGEEMAITGIEAGPDYDFVYNLEVANVHTYCASGVRVHNSGGGPGGCCGSSGKGG